MQLPHFPTAAAVAAIIIAIATPTLACVDFGVDINQYNFAAGNLKDNGQTICTVNSYGDNTGWNMKCNSGYSARINFSNDVVSYNTPHGKYTFATKCTDNGSNTVCTASPFC